MEAYKRCSHTVWDCEYHVVWVTKYRYRVLEGDVGVRCRELLRETATAHEMVIHADPAQPVVIDEVWVEYIKNQRPPEPDDNFNVT